MIQDVCFLISDFLSLKDLVFLCFVCKDFRVAFGNKLDSRLFNIGLFLSKNMFEWSFVIDFDYFIKTNKMNDKWVSFRIKDLVFEKNVLISEWKELLKRNVHMCLYLQSEIIKSKVKSNLIPLFITIFDEEQDKSITIEIQQNEMNKIYITSRKVDKLFKKDFFLV